MGSPGSAITVKSVEMPVEKPGENRWKDVCGRVKCRQ